MDRDRDLAASLVAGARGFGLCIVWALLRGCCSTPGPRDRAVVEPLKRLGAEVMTRRGGDGCRVFASVGPDATASLLRTVPGGLGCLGGCGNLRVLRGRILSLLDERVALRVGNATETGWSAVWRLPRVAVPRSFRRASDGWANTGP